MGSSSLQCPCDGWDKSYTIYKDVIGMVQVDQTDAATLTDTLKDFLIRSGLQLSNCRGQT